MAKIDLLATLFPEFFQTERSAERHPEVEAQRLSDTPLAAPLRAVSAHATSSLAELSRLAAARGHETSRFGQKVGRLFSTIRDRFADHLIDTERSYRGTLLGVRHGLDLVVLVGAVARAQGDAELAEFCDRWLETRTRLANELQARLVWFAQHPERARAHPKSVSAPPDHSHPAGSA
jgi:hypothetical protein